MIIMTIITGSDISKIEILNIFGNDFGAFGGPERGKSHFTSQKELGNLVNILCVFFFQKKTSNKTLVCQNFDLPNVCTGWQ